METPQTIVSRRIAVAASQFQQQRTGHPPQSVNVILGEDTVVITLHGALSPAEKALAQSTAGAAQVQEFHRQLFATTAFDFRQEITRITGMEVLEAAAEVEPASGAVVHVFTTGSIVQVFRLGRLCFPDATADTPFPAIPERKPP
jgi:uncharacterized protein YbcI